MNWLQRKLATLDLDEIFSYNTTKEVRMLDRRLGIVCWFIRALVLAYVIGYVFVAKEGYTDTEVGFGQAAVRVNGSAHSMVNGIARIWDATDTAPALENGATFVATTAHVTKEQMMGDCGNQANPCSDSSGCTANPPLSEGACVFGACVEKQWCPAFSESSATTERHEIVGGGAIALWVTGSISFPTLDASRLFSTMDAGVATPYAGAGAPDGVSTTVLAPPDAGGHAPNYFTLGQLLELAGTDYASAKSAGATIGVTLLWSCFVDSPAPCAPAVQVERIDTSEHRRGFQHEYGHYYRLADGGEDRRDLYTVKGVRVLVTSRGVGKRVSLSAIILQISSMIALLWLANFFADVLMLHVLPERKHYRAYKQERTPDFSDLRNKIAEVEGEKKKLRDRKNRFATKLTDDM